MTQQRLIGDLRLVIENAEELLKSLRIFYNKKRQEAITTELGEIVSGAAALEA